MLRGNHQIILDDVDKYSSNTSRFVEGMTLDALVTDEDNLIFLETVMADMVTKVMNNTVPVTTDSYAISAGKADVNGVQLRAAILNNMIKVSVLHNFGGIKPNRNSYRILIARVNRKFIGDKINDVIQDVISSPDEVEDEFYRRGNEMNFPFGLDRKKSGFAKTGHSYGALSTAKRLVEPHIDDYMVIRDSKTAPHKLYNNTVHENEFAYSYFNKLSNRLN